MISQKLEAGLVFGSVRIFRRALRKFDVDKDFELMFVKNKKDMVRIHASQFVNSTSFLIKSLKGERHNCPK